jgi:predicted DNA-binding transcriptional regulator AlpA
MPLGSFLNEREPSLITAPSLLNDRQVSIMLGVSLASVRRWRLLRQGPRYIRVGASSIRYRPADIESFLNSRTSGGAPQEVR